MGQISSSSSCHLVFDGEWACAMAKSTSSRGVHRYSGCRLWGTSRCVCAATKVYPIDRIQIKTCQCYAIASRLGLCNSFRVERSNCAYLFTHFDCFLSKFVYMANKFNGHIGYHFYSIAPNLHQFEWNNHFKGVRALACSILWPLHGIVPILNGFSNPCDVHNVYKRVKVIFNTNGCYSIRICHLCYINVNKP